MPAVFCYGLCHMSIQEFTECYLTHKKAGLCAVMSMWLVHIKEHVWSIGYAQPPSFYLWASRGVKCCAGGLNKKEVWPCMRGQPVCSPGSWSGRGWLPLKKWNDSDWKVALAVESCEAHSIILQVFYSALYQVPNLSYLICPFSIMAGWLIFAMWQPYLFDNGSRDVVWNTFKRIHKKP